MTGSYLMFYYMFYFKNQSYVHQVSCLASSCLFFNCIASKDDCSKVKEYRNLSGVSKELFCQIPSVSAKEFFLHTRGKIQLITHLCITNSLKNRCLYCSLMMDVSHITCCTTGRCSDSLVKRVK